MENEEPITPVLFRRPRSKRLFENDGVTAVFPTEKLLDGQPDAVTCYAHVGQHGQCSLRLMTGMQYRPASPEEYEGLKKELESEPYNYRLKVYKRTQREWR